MGKCLMIGSTVCDVRIAVDRLPQREGDVHIHNHSLSLGGCAFNVASLFQACGVEHDFLSPVGSGLYGDFVAEELAKLGFTDLLRVPEENGCCYCFVEEDGERTFLSYHGAEYRFSGDWLAAYADQTYDYIYLCGLEVEEETGAELVAAVSRLSGQLVFAPGPRGHLIDPGLLEDIYACSPILHLNEDEVQALAGQEGLEAAVLALYAKTGAPLIVTKGKEGAIAYDGDWHQAGAYVTQVVDTIGAGDSHVAAVMLVLSLGKSLAAALDVANRVASQVVATSGGQLPKADAQELVRKLGLAN